MTDQSIERALGRIRGGDTTATAELFDAFEPFLRGLVSRRLPARVRTRFDSADIVQSAWVTLLEGFNAARWQFPDAAHLRALVTRVVLCRLYDRARSAGRQTRREERIAELAGEVTGTEPRPSEQLRAASAWETLLAACPGEYQQVLELRRMGHTCEEIGNRIGLHPGSVRRLLRQLACRIAFDDTTQPPTANAD